MGLHPGRGRPGRRHGAGAAESGARYWAIGLVLVTMGRGEGYCRPPGSIWPGAKDPWHIPLCTAPLAPCAPTAIADRSSSAPKRAPCCNAPQAPGKRLWPVRRAVLLVSCGLWPPPRVTRRGHRDSPRRPRDRTSRTDPTQPTQQRSLSLFSRGVVPRVCLFWRCSGKAVLRPGPVCVCST